VEDQGSELEKTCLPPAFFPTITSGSAEGGRALTLAEQKANAVGAENTLHHGETLLVVSARDAEPVALELIAKAVTADLLRHALVVERKPEARDLDEKRPRREIPVGRSQHPRLALSATAWPLHCDCLAPVTAAREPARRPGLCRLLPLEPAPPISPATVEGFRRGCAAHSFFSSSMAKAFWAPVSGQEMLSCTTRVVRASEGAGRREVLLLKNQHPNKAISRVGTELGGGTHQHDSAKECKRSEGWQRYI